ncbi:uncharacterized protein LOC134696012 isoform X2 [Mytilus trossulus]|uniref:uncharacterized protein LOC134696012 isoform X2 n=1 Tax=Mytilus trossulus TaxID=6551 RepID=UPI0030042779
MFKLTALLVGMASVLHRTTGMECVRCVDVKTDISKAHNLEKIKNNIADFSNLRRSECVKTISNAANTNLLSCKPSSALQREHKCGTIIGDVVLHQAYLQKYLRLFQSVDA